MTPKRAFQQHRSNAQARGISFEMTFDEWWAIWKDYFHMRGRGTNALCMARENDTGPYAVGNVYLTTNLGNALDVDPKKRKNAPLPDEERIERERKRDVWVKKPGRFSPNGELKSHLEYKQSCNPEESVAD